MSGLGKFLAGILSSVIVLAIGYYFFNDRPGEPEVLVTEKTLPLPTETVDSLFWNLADRNGDLVNLAKLKEKSLYRIGVPYGLGFRLLEIENTGTDTYEKVEILTNDLLKVVVQQGKTAEVFEGELAGKVFRVTPGAKLQVLGVGDLTSAFGNGKFTVMIGGKAIPIEDITVEPSESNFSTVMWFRRNSFFLTFGLPMIMWGIFIVAIGIVGAVVQNSKSKAVEAKVPQEPPTPNVSA